MDALLPFMRSFWSVWLMVLFLGIVAWALWPSRQREMDENARIPLRDEETANGHQG